MILALLYDNAIIAAGTTIGEGAALERLNAVRYWLHAACTPLLVIASLSLLQKEYFSFARSRWVRAVAWAVTSGLIVYQGFIAAAETSKLKAVTEHGVLHYQPAGETGPPIMVIFVTAMLFAAGLLLWFRRRSPWLALGVILLLGGVVVTRSNPMLHNVFECFLIVSLLLALRRSVSPR